MPADRLSNADEKRIAAAVAHFTENAKAFDIFAKSVILNLEAHSNLAAHTHFLKYRIKDAEHLARKLRRKELDRRRSNSSEPSIDAGNLFQRINDLAGIRLIHLHTDEIGIIHKSLLEVIDSQQYRLLEEPVANCWDVEYEAVYSAVGIKTYRRESMYTTVHYVIEANQRDKISCEIQVRTLADEVWGEVSHRVNYPEECQNTSCKDQLKVLARLTSGCTRLVDSIFRTRDGG